MRPRTSITMALIAAAVLLVLANPASAKLRVKIDVEASDDKIKNTLQESMKARLNSTERYTITDSDLGMELFVDNQIIGQPSAG